MKKIFIISALVLFQITVNANVTAYLTYSTFHTPTSGSYVETYLSIIGNSLKFEKNTNGKYQGAVNIAISFTQNGEIKSGQKYTLASPEVNDTITTFPNFLDQQRYTLPNGTYEMEISISDYHNKSIKPFVTKVPITINFSDNVVSMSDIQLLESYKKSSTPSINKKRL